MDGDMFRSSSSSVCFGLGFQLFSYDDTLIDFYHLGYVTKYGKRVNCKFITRPATEANIRLFWKIEALSLKVDYKFLLLPMITSKSICGNNIVASYDFDISGKEYIKGKNYKIIEKPEGVIHVWWGTQISNMLRTIEEMHKKRVFHGDLQNPSCYVIRDSTVYLIMPAIDGRDMSDDDIEFHTRKDLKDFAEFLVNHASPEHHSYDWIHFQSLFEYAKIAEIRGHPYLKDEPSRLNHLHALMDCCLDQWDLTDEQWDGIQHLLREKYEELYRSRVQGQGWGCLLPHNSRYRAIFDNPGEFEAYNPYDYMDLIRFVRGVMEYVNEYEPRKTDCEIERDMHEIFPGLTSQLHTCLVEFSARDGNEGVFSH